MGGAGNEAEVVKRERGGGATLTSLSLSKLSDL